VSPTPSAPASSKKKTTAVKIKPIDLSPEITGKRTRYWVGTTPNCPLQNVHAGGICFPLFRGMPIFNDAGVPDRPLEYGNFADLTEYQVKNVCDGIRMRVLRIYGGDGDRLLGVADTEDVTPRQPQRAQMFIADGKRYHAAPNDQPLARFVYMHRAEDLTLVDMEDFPPETMEERPKES